LCSPPPQLLSPPTPEASLPEIKLQLQNQEELVPQAAMNGYSIGESIRKVNGSDQGMPGSQDQDHKCKN
jgi:hypothetical protein